MRRRNVYAVDSDRVTLLYIQGHLTQRTREEKYDAFETQGSISIRDLYNKLSLGIKCGFRPKGVQFHFILQ